MSFPAECALHGPGRDNGYTVIYDGFATIYYENGDIIGTSANDVVVHWTKPPIYSTPERAAESAKRHMRKQRGIPPHGSW